MKIAIFIAVGVLFLFAVVWVIGFLKHRARMQHYIFAHQLLPAQMFADPATVLVPMVSETGYSEEGRAHLLQFWEAAGEGQSGDDVVRADGLTYSMEVLGHPNSTAFFVTLPPPVKKSEAHFVLMVFDAPGLCVGTPRQLRYFVLENYGERDGALKTQLGEWVAKDDGSLKYADHGEGLPATKEAFMAKVEEIIRASGSQPAAAAERQA